MNKQQPNGVVFRTLAQINAGRSFLANLGGFVCVALMLGLANIFCRSVLHTDLMFELRLLIVAVALYFFVPPLVLWLWTGRTSDTQ
ncbi:hypothetical protein [Acetobacter orleanensis]|uniref:Uncharacterized protein n=1 Tax=Acetobacter orleanensis TaxID=104099 RepID=A0A4Y3TKP4_9PROT|nr:hypothetical protein [Acetobacter orleanensis]KXV63530.1 hypothetical protein AD949_06955 [Acetobacter orleanensis]PCD79908.1 hypothetical protein CO710_03320 [Acetobacter orleanensis]GAN68211.1 hypothetical protein Abol_015_050 [Acetobacter orleanensis JCM 7639]GBR31393.1 hypothetical protein AA0473_2527 [Acetobacter orleanensis NRIC 0473]GEB82896.1 hypothetical protein AOR01nite_13730 [Acetobacter orleanensis]